MYHVSQRQSSIYLVDVCISPSNDLLYTCIVHEQHSHYPDKLFYRLIVFVLFRSIAVIKLYLDSMGNICANGFALLGYYTV